VIKRWKPFLEKARLSGKAVNTGEYNVTCRNGSVRICELYATFLADTLVVTFNDITGRKKAEQEILDISFHDQLTGLYNRRFFEEELKRLDTKRQFPLSIIMGDLNGLKLINDVFGHLEGDRLLKKSAEILKKASRSDDILARWGGDEFIILLPKTSTADTEEIVQRIKNECKKTNSQKIPMSLSIGAAQKETTAQDMKAVVMDAENNMYRNKLIEKHSITSSIVFALDRALYEKSSETKAHTDRICKLALKLGESIKLHTSQLDELSLLASLHDIGKVAIPEKILLKKGALTEKEWLVIKRHPEIGFNIAQSSPQIAHIAKPILYCHENFDGSGYPLGLKRESIPVISRIILIVDAYDVMTTGRTYKLPVSKDDAIKELRKCAGSLFDPVMVDKFIEILSKQKT
jgi:diguanylate cyclase (GGDEF)-like protein